MLAQKTKTLSLAMACFIALTGLVYGQQPQQPSQRYQPVPPSVHVPPQDIQRVGSQQRPSHSDFQRGAMRQQANPTSRYTFSDQIPERPQFERGTVIQTSYVADENNGPDVPEILARTAQQPLENTPTSANEFLATRPASSTDLRNVPASASTTQMVQTMQQRMPRVDPKAITSHQELMNKQLERIRDRAAQEAEKLSVAASQMTAQPVQQNAQAQTNSEADYAAMEESFIEEVLAATSQPISAPVQQTEKSDLTAPMLSATPVRVASNDMSEKPANEIRQVSRETSSDQTNRSSELTTQTKPEISLAAPGIEVQTFGPRSIGINKTSTYKIVVTNQGRTDASRILIGINMPQWVDIANTNLSNGQKEITDGVNQARLVWTVDRVPANSTQTITIEAVPRKAEMFDLGVEWTFAPRVGMTHVEVTEPRLEMKIAGPHDVLYGEKAIYHVTVRNPGTGAAENVSVMLPEALGGERASLGNIPAGREKNFQVELLARTAGQLDLTATAAADGDLNTSATRQIDVRRANLTIIIDGPPMKYSGSAGQYSISISNTGDATAQEIVAAIALPSGVKYLGGVDAASEIDGGLRWPVGSLDAGQQRTFKINCELNAAGELQIEAGARGQGDLAASGACITAVETVADLVLAVEDPKGPLPTGQDVVYQIRVKNRGTRAARDVELVMQFSEGIEPVKAQGLKHRIVPGQVLFSPIAQIDPGEEMNFQVTGKAFRPDTHIFRAQLTCADSDSREITEGTTRFFGDAIEAPAAAPAATESTDTTTADADAEFSAESSEFKR